MPSANQTGVCALCREDRELRESHIASKFLWRQSGLTGDKKSFAVTSPSHPELDEPHRQDGFKEYLLCSECEKQFETYETYTARILFHKNGPFHNRPGSHYVWSGLDYPKLKLFQMSILWRMGVSTHPFYCRVELGKHQEVLRSMLKAKDPGKPWQYGCMATLLGHGGAPLKGVFSQPLKAKKFKHHCYRYTIAGMHWIHYVTSHPLESHLRSVMLQPDGTWILFNGEITDFSELSIQVEYFQQNHRKVQQDAAE